MTETLRALGQWLLLVFAGMLMGLALGQLLDAALWFASHDYVFPYGYYRERGVQSGVLLGMISGTTLHWRHRCCTFRILWCGVLAAALFVIVASLLSGSVAALAAKIAPEWSVGAVMTTPARHALCWGLVWGAKWGAVLSMLVFAWFVCRAIPEAAITATGSSSRDIR